jgi:adenosine deaminase
MNESSSAASVEKVELHCHTDGVLDGALVRSLARRGEVFPHDPAALERMLPVASLADWLRDYGPIGEACRQPPERLLPILAVHVENLAAQRVSYAELMVNGLLFPPGDEGEMLELFRRLREQVQAAGGATTAVELLVAVARGPVEKLERQASRILLLARHGLIAGVAIAGDERACTIRSLSHVIGQLRDAGLGIEIHAGEMCGPESVWDALQYGMPDRIGHGVRAFEDEDLVQELCARDLHVEMCPTSNLRLGVVSDLQHHPIARARELGMNYSVNTDDPGPFGCTLTSELELLERELGFTVANLQQIRDNAWRSRFGKG